MSVENGSEKRNAEEAIDDEPDEWDKRIIKTGCHEENMKLLLCHADTNDWRKCVAEMKAFRECWDNNQNNKRTQTKDNDLSGF
ncbi:hypothetical protein PACTADRAFT_51556 [Pachysolen tannophilus NRRL Y-2460]|uniref:CHCH domain-containing protein n=1 Tax=Pachysolen tannophilus NRRL Y-2460 TaxID=669874 RepID=A0A1E4TPY3_PACTA|nr:hypothetical protein PACTADRAFT_51556 [Pachysolen tannophilus NRRL Y-2460]